jgi:hypothetical protein
MPFSFMICYANVIILQISETARQIKYVRLF